MQDTPEPPKQVREQAAKPQASASTRVPAVIVAVVAVAVAGLSIWYLLRGEPLLVQGEVDATRLDIAARVDERVAEISRRARPKRCGRRRAGQDRQSGNHCQE